MQERKAKHRRPTGGVNMESQDGALVRIEMALERLERKVELAHAPRLLTRQQAAELLGCGGTKLKALIDSGELRQKKLGGRWMVPMSEVVRLTSLSAPRSGAPEPRLRGESPAVMAERVRESIRTRRKRD